MVLGDSGVGKSSILSRYVDREFKAEYDPTIGVDYKTKKVEDGKKCIQFNFWDLSGHPEFYEIRNEFYRDAQAIIIVVDVTIRNTLEAADMWVKEAQELGATNLPTILVANKVTFVVSCPARGSKNGGAIPRQ